MTDLGGTSPRRRTGSVLVTGVPRSGTTWLARLLAHAGGAALAGREPMNPHHGQFRLGGSISAWTRLSTPTGRQQRILRRAYRGLEPRVYGRYGYRQWSAPLPWTRVIVKDPFALLSIEVIAATTGALPVLVYRHPGAVLASYRRMGWHPDIEELERAAPELARFADGPACDDVDEMGWFWTRCHQIALDQLERVPSSVVVSHRELSLGGSPAVRALFAACGLAWSDGASREVAHGTEATSAEPAAGDRLHVMNRSPMEVADAWRKHVDADVVARLEHLTAETFSDLEMRRLGVGL